MCSGFGSGQLGHGTYASVKEIFPIFIKVLNQDKRMSTVVSFLNYHVLYNYLSVSGEGPISNLRTLEKLVMATKHPRLKKKKKKKEEERKKIRSLENPRGPQNKKRSYCFFT